MAPEKSIWDHKSDKDLLLAIIEEKAVLKWPTIATIMQTKGYTFTQEGCRQHFQKIRREAKSGGGGDGGVSPPRNFGPRVQKTGSSAKSTPRKHKSMTDSFSTNNTSLATSRGSFGTSDGHLCEGDDEEMVTPIKRKRVETTEGLDNEGRNASMSNIEGHDGQKSPIELEEGGLYENFYV